MRIALVGAGAFGEKHLDAIASISDVEVSTIVSVSLHEAIELGNRYGITDVSDSYEATLERGDIDAVILTTPTPLHAKQAIAAMEAGKHVEVEIPVADNWTDAQAVMAKQLETGLVCMVGHTRRFNPSHQWIKKKIESGEFNIQAMDVQTYFLRRINMNAKGMPRSWSDHLLWHHAAHSIDIFQYMTGSKVVNANVLQGPKNADLGIAMDMSIQLKSEKGQIFSLSLSFNNDGPFGTFFRYIGDTGTFLARYDELYTGTNDPIDVSRMDISMNGIELQDREFFAAIRERREPNASVSQVLGCYRVIGELAANLEGQDGWS